MVFIFTCHSPSLEQWGNVRFNTTTTSLDQNEVLYPYRILQRLQASSSKDLLNIFITKAVVFLPGGHANPPPGKWLWVASILRTLRWVRTQIWWQWWRGRRYAEWARLQCHERDIATCKTNTRAQWWCSRDKDEWTNFQQIHHQRPSENDHHLCQSILHLPLRRIV